MVDHRAVHLVRADAVSPACFPPLEGRTTNGEHTLPQLIKKNTYSKSTFSERSMSL